MIILYKHPFIICLFIFQVDELRSVDQEKIDYDYQDDYDDRRSSSRPDEIEEKMPQSIDVETAAVITMIDLGGSQTHSHQNTSYDSERAAINNNVPV